MIKIKLFCAAGFSTGMLVKKMELAAEERGLEIEIKAHPQGKIEDNIGDADVVLLGPQVAYTLSKSKEICDKKSVPIDVIPMADYGVLNGKNVLNFALKLIEDYKNK